VVAVNVQVDSKLWRLAASVEKDVSKVVNEALHLWLQRKLIICPVTNSFCTHTGPCNDCDITKKIKQQ
jgi:hypothetical protein